MTSETKKEEGVPHVTLPGYICDDEESTQDPLFVMDWRSFIPQPMINKINKKLQKRGENTEKIKDREDRHHEDEEDSEREDSLDEDEKSACSEDHDERMEKEFKKIRKKLAREFIHKTTLHGVNYMSNPDHSVRRRSCWTIIFLFMFTSFLISSWLHFLEFVNHPVKSVISLEEQTTATFPAMTLCNINLIRLSFLEDEERLISANHRLLKTVMENFYGFNSHGTLFGGSLPESLDLSRLQGLNATFFIEEGAHRMEDMMITCTWKERECDESIFKARWTNFGYCYTFNEPIGAEPDYVTKPGRHEELSLALNVQQDEYSGGGMNGAVGFVVMLHEQEDVPLVYDFGFLASPGFLTQVAIRKKVRTSLQSPFPSDCRKEPSKYYDGEYTISKCVTSQEMDKVINECSCTMPYMPKQDGYQLCDAYQMVICYDLLTQPKHKCDRPCHEVIYDESISMTIAPSLRAAKKLEKQMDVNFSQLMANLAQFSLFYEDLSIEKTKEVPSYDFKDLTSGIGGELGLFLGASIITIAEFVDFIIIGKYYENRFLRKWFTRTKAKLKADTSSRWPWWLRILNYKTWANVSTKKNSTISPEEQIGTMTNDLNGSDVHARSCVWYVEPPMYQPSTETLTTPNRFIPGSPAPTLEEFLPYLPCYPSDTENVN